MADSGSSMAVLQSINLGDLLKEREGESSRPERQTLGSVLKIDDPRRPSQSLLDILNSEDQSNTHINSRVSRRSLLINRLKLRRAAILSWRTAAAQLALTRQGRSPGRTPVSGIVRGRVVAAELLESTLTPMPPPSRPSMNLASALAAERLRTPADGSSLDDVAPSSTSIVPSSGSSTPLRVSLMALLEEADRHSRDSAAAAERNFRGSLLKDWDKASNEKEVESTEGAKVEYVCCVCMVRHKGAAFIPCGHTFCRVCSRELWVNRGSCPLCNGFILEILDIF